MAENPLEPRSNHDFEAMQNLLLAYTSLYRFRTMANETILVVVVFGVLLVDGQKKGGMTTIESAAVMVIFTALAFVLMTSLNGVAADSLGLAKKWKLSRRVGLATKLTVSNWLTLGRSVYPEVHQEIVSEMHSHAMPFEGGEPNIAACRTLLATHRAEINTL